MPKDTLFELNKSLQEIYDDGMQIRNRIVISNNEYKIKRQELDNLRKKNNQSIDDLTTALKHCKQGYKKHSIWSYICAITLGLGIAGIIAGSSLSISILVTISSVFTTTYNLISSINYKKVANNYKMALDLAKVAGKKIQDASSLLDVEHKIDITTLKIDLLNKLISFKRLKKRKNELELKTGKIDTQTPLKENFDLPLTING